MLNPAIFREYDIRGVADLELRDVDIELLGRGAGTYLRRHGGDRVNVGRDCRLSSERLRNALVCGLKASGCQVADIGVAPTPLLYYSVFHLQAAAAVMITGSHNPPEYNGFKVVSGAATIYGAEIQAIREIIDRLRQREPIIWVACVVLLALIASAWLVGTLQRLFGQ